MSMAGPSSLTSGALLLPSRETRTVRGMCKVTAAGATENVEVGLYSFTDTEAKTGTQLVISFSDTVRVG